MSGEVDGLKLQGMSLAQASGNVFIDSEEQLRVNRHEFHCLDMRGPVCGSHSPAAVAAATGFLEGGVLS